MFSMTEQLQLPSMSRSSSDRSDSSTGGRPVSMPSSQPYSYPAEDKLYSNLYWEEENLEASHHGGSDTGLLEPLLWDLDSKDPSPSLDLELSLDLAKKLVLANQAMGLDQENPPVGSFDRTFPPPGVNSSVLQPRCSNPRWVMVLVFLSDLISYSGSRQRFAATSRRREAACTGSSASLLTGSTNSG